MVTRGEVTDWADRIREEETRKLREEIPNYNELPEMEKWKLRLERKYLSHTSEEALWRQGK